MKGTRYLWLAACGKVEFVPTKPFRIATAEAFVGESSLGDERDEDDVTINGKLLKLRKFKIASMRLPEFV